MCGGWGQAQVNMGTSHSLVDMKERGRSTGEMGQDLEWKNLI